MQKLLQSVLSLALVVSILFVSSCKKDEDDPNLSKTQLLTEKSWKPTKVKAFGVEGPPDDCDKDDTYTFASGGTFTQSEGSVKCDPDDPDSYSGTWEFKDNEKFIALTISGFTIDQEILELTTTKLRVKYIVPIFEVEVEETYGHP